MNFTNAQLSKAVEEITPDVLPLIARALSANATHSRTATVTVTLTAKRTKESPGVVSLFSALKIKEPKAARSTLSAPLPEVELGRWKADEDPGQKRISESDE